MTGLAFNDYQMALDSQTAPNLSGVVHAFSAILPRIWEEAHEQGKGTKWVNEHPISRLFAEQIHHLVSENWDQDPLAAYARANRICVLMAAKGGSDDE